MDINDYSGRTGRMIGEDGQIYNKVELLRAAGSTAEAVGESSVNITQFSPRSGRLIGEDGKLYNEVDLLRSLGEGRGDYTALANKPMINGNELVGDKTAAELGIWGVNTVTVKTISALPETGEESKIYIVAENNMLYRWNGEEQRYYSVGSSGASIYRIDGEILNITTTDTI